MQRVLSFSKTLKFNATMYSNLIEEPHILYIRIYA